MPTGRRGFTIIELLVTMGIIGLLAGMLLPAVQSARESARKAQCGNHLKQLGVAFSSYHNTWRTFPASWDGPHPPFLNVTAVDPWSRPTYYTALLTYIEQNNQTPGRPHPIALFFCPARRGAFVGPKDDYAAGRHPDEFFQNGWESILGGPYVSNSGYIYPAYVGLNSVTDGSSNTLLLSHKAMQPSQYASVWGPWIYSGGAVGWTYTGDNGGWAGPCGNLEHERDPRFFVRDTDDPAIVFDVGSSHPTSMPSLFADGSVRSLDYATAAEIIPRLWAFNDGSSLTSTAP